MQRPLPVKRTWHGDFLAAERSEILVWFEFCHIGSEILVWFEFLSPK